MISASKMTNVKTSSHPNISDTKLCSFWNDCSVYISREVFPPCLVTSLVTHFIHPGG